MFSLKPPARPGFHFFTSAALIIGLALTFLALTAQPAPAAKSGWSKLVGSEDHLARLFPARTVISGKSMAHGGKVAGQFNCSIVRGKDGGLRVEFNSVKAASSCNLDEQLTLQGSDMAFHLNRSDTKPLRKHDRRAAAVCPGGLELVYYNDGRPFKSKKVEFGPGGLAADNLYIYLQALLLKGVRQSFKAPIMINSIGITAPGKFSLSQVVAKPGKLPGGPLPQDMTAALKKGGPYLIWTMKVGGVIGLLSREKHHIAFNAAPPYAFAGYWGGPKGGEEYIYRTRISIKN